MKKSKILLITLIITIILVAGCNKPAPAVSKEAAISSETTTSILSKVSTKEPSEMILQLDDLPQGYELNERTEMFSSDIGEYAKSLGWKRGYDAIYIKVDKDVPDLYTTIAHYISIYPTENIQKIVLRPKEDIIKGIKETSEKKDYGNITVKIDDISNPNIGDISKAYRVTIIDDITKEEVIIYFIEFGKKDVYNHLAIEGTTGVDFELLRELAKKVERKI